jgi:PIN family toxin-antitoxin system, toxin component
MLLLDTNILSELRKLNSDKIHPAVQKWAEATPFSQSYISAISLTEIKMGILSLARKDPMQANRLKLWFENVILQDYQARILPVDKAVALQCASLHIPDKKPINDAFIAATALVHDLVLVTRNMKDFEQTGVKLLNPFDY